MYNKQKQKLNDKILKAANRRNKKYLNNKIPQK